MKPLTFWNRLGRAVRDRSFIVGAILVSLFLLAAVLGPELAPHDPYLRDRIQTIDGIPQRAPFPPSELYPLGTDDQGRDMLSLLLHGARQTLVIAFVATTVRLLLALVLGTLAGWWPGSPFDRLITALIEFLAAVPGLILAILLVLAVGIERGQISFVVALSLVGWGEVTQLVRGHVLTLRQRLFVLASRAVGLGPLQILSRHILPNLLSTLLALAALEMGAVLLLLGELGFVHIFIGGGGVYADDALGVVHYFDVPDWGAMLGTSWRYFRAQPWLPMAPALAFFVAILGFNLFGYGLQRFIEKGRFHPSGWSLLRLLAVIALVLLGARALLSSTTPEVRFARMVESFDLQRAWNDVAYLTQPALGGRPTGPGGGFDAAAYIASQFQQAGLTPFPHGDYYQLYRAPCGHISAAPALQLLGSDGQPRLDLTAEASFDPLHPFAWEGTTEAELVVAGNVRQSTRLTAPSGSILLLLDADQSLPGSWFLEIRYAGVLRVVPDAALAAGQIPPVARTSFDIGSYPNLRIGETAARQLLAEAGLDLDALREELATGEQVMQPTGLRLRLEAGLTYEEVTALNVVGYMPAANIRTQGERILVMAPYTGPLPGEGEFYPGADENASGVAVMLEVIRLWRDVQFDPERTVVFAAVDAGGASYFSTNPILPTGGGDTWTVVILQGLGAGSERLARTEVGYGLARTLDQSARRFGVRTEPLEDWRFFFASYSAGRVSRYDPAYSGLAITRLGDGLSGTQADTMERMDPAALYEAGQSVAHFLMVLSNR